ncbi:MAG: autotransporter domain-containing protein [Prosthecobacter sp.]
MIPTHLKNTVPQGTPLRRSGKPGLLRKIAGSSVAAVLTLGSFTPFAQAGQLWDGGNGTANWSAINNWNPDGLPNFGAPIIFGGIIQVLTTNDVTAITSGITFDPTAGAFTLNGNAVTNTDNIVNQSINDQLIDLDITLGNSQLWQTLAGGDLTMTGAVALNGNTLSTLAGVGAPITIGDVISGNGAVSHTGGTLNLNSANTYVGATSINSAVLGDGVLNANVANALPTALGRSAVTMDNAGAGGSTLNIGGSIGFPLGASQSIASLASTQTTSQVTLGGNTLTIGTGAGSTDFAGAISGPGSVVKDDLSTQVLSGTNTYTGTTDITGGTLVVNGQHINAGSYNIGGNGGAVEVLAGSTVGGLNGIGLTGLNSVNVLAGGSISVGDPAFNVPSVLSISNPGNVAITMAAGSTLQIDIFAGAGLGNNTGNPASSDRLNLAGTLASGINGGVLVVGNPLGLTGFRGGDSWLLVNMATLNGPGNITGTIGQNANGFNGLNDAALNLASTQVGNFNQTSGVYTVIDTITGLQMANIMGESVLSAAGSMLSDVNGRLFFLRAGYGERGYDGSLSASLESGEGDKSSSPTPVVASDSYEWQAFINANYSNIQIDPVGAQQAGFDADTWTAGVGFERRITNNVVIGFAANWLESYQDFSNNVGQLDMTGITLSAYASYVKNSFWADALYSFGNFDIETQRNTIGFAAANGETEAQTHALQFNTGWNFRLQNNTLVTGPFIGLDYMHATVDGFDESSGGLAALRYNSRDYDSLVSRIGWALSKKIDTDFALITAQVRLSYERQNIKYDNQTSVTLLNQPFTANGAQQNLGQDYLVAGAGLNFQFTPRFGVLLNYQGQFFRESVQSHYIGVRAGFTF